ncbi:MAG: adenylate/guanylate cyclase domain-containing protein [Actinobacteria bacterium]|nr:adenylate/guanylate cyclase domain-containing protein [Actinomycetota bacterium]
MTAPARTTLTFLFTDIEGSTRQWEELPEMSATVERHFQVLRCAVEHHGGEVFSTMGDGVAAAFVSAEAAVDAAVMAQRSMPDVGVAVRMGLHTGEVERVDDDFRGRPVNRAARIMAAGHGGQILVSDVTAALARPSADSTRFLDLGHHRLRDLTEPERLWQVVHPELTASFPPVRGLDTYSNNLPSQRTSLIGREREVARVAGLVGTHRVITLTGVGGVGKTRLAVQVAADLLPTFSNAWFVELASVSDADDVPDTVARTLGATAISDPFATAAALLGGDRTLLVVDNCEHVVDSVADLVDRLTEVCPNLRVLATSREALGVDGEFVVKVRSLDAPTASELFVSRLEAAGADVNPVDHRLVQSICCRLDGIPLAIELAAARAATLGVPAVLGALDDRFNLLSGGRRRAMDRHGTMRATLDWSYRLLSADEQRLFQRLSVCPNGFELDMVQHLGAAIDLAEHEATELLTSLVNKNMVAPETTEFGVRYRMLETIRAYGLEQLDERGEWQCAALALAEWVATITDFPFVRTFTAEVERASIRLERESESWREAVLLAIRLRSGDLASRLCSPAVGFFLLGRHDLADDLWPLLELCDPVPEQRRAVVVCLAVAAAGSVEPAQLQAWADEIHAADEQERSGLGTLLHWLVLAWRNDFVGASELCRQAAFDATLPIEARDMMLGIAVLERFSLTGSRDDPHGLVGRAIEAGERSEVALHRVTNRLGAAWALAETEPERALELVRLALADIALVPALTRLTLPGSASRLLAQLDPQVAAMGLLEQLETNPSRRSFVDLIPTFYATALLDRVGHPAASSALATLTVSSAAPFLSMMDFVDLASRAAAAASAMSLDELESTVRTALREIAAGSGS